MAINLSISVKANDTSKVDLYHPRTREKVGTLVIAGPDHERTRAWKREINDRRQRRGYKEDLESEVQEGLCRRTIGWEGVKDRDGNEAPFDASALPELYAQTWLMGQALEALNEDGFFFQE